MPKVRIREVDIQGPASPTSMQAILEQHRKTSMKTRVPSSSKRPLAMPDVVDFGSLPPLPSSRSSSLLDYDMGTNGKVQDGPGHEKVLTASTSESSIIVNPDVEE
jgi:hypothetical protein